MKLTFLNIFLVIITLIFIYVLLMSFLKWLITYLSKKVFNHKNFKDYFDITKKQRKESFKNYCKGTSIKK